MNTQELTRLAFVEERDGKEAAIAFAKQTLRIYRTAVKRNQEGKRSPYGGAFRRKLLESCLDLRRYLRSQGQ